MAKKRSKSEASSSAGTRVRTKEHVNTAVIVIVVAVLSFCLKAAWTQTPSPPSPLEEGGSTSHAAASAAANAVGTALRGLKWDEALAAVQTITSVSGNAVPPSMLPIAVAAHAMASLQGPTSLGGICSGACGRDAPREHTPTGSSSSRRQSGIDNASAQAAFKTALHAIAAAVTTSRSAGWVEQTRSALLAATRARSLTALKTIADVLRYERTRDPWSVEDEAAMFAPPLLQLAVTTRSEVTTLSRILLEQHVGGVRLRRAKAWLRSVPGKPAATLAAATAGLHGSGATDNGTSTEKTTEFEGPEPTTMVAVQLVREVMGLWTKEFVKVLLELGCDPSARDEQGENAVHVAALYGNTAALATMLDASAAGSRGGDDDAGGGAVAELVDATSKSGHVAVELAAMRGRVLTTCHLLHRLNAATTERVPSYLAVYGVHSDDCLAMLEGRPPPRRTTPWAEGTPMTAKDVSLQQLHPSLVEAVVAPCKTSVKPVTSVSSSSMTPTRFFFEFYMAGHPVLVKGGAADWLFRQAWDPTALQSVHGHLPVAPEQLPFAKAFGIGLQKGGVGSASEGADAGKDGGGVEGESTLGDFIKTWSQQHSPAQQGEGGGAGADAGSARYIFQIGDPTVAALMEAAEIPSMPSQLNPAGRSPFIAKAPQFYAGAAGTGAPVHVHGDAWNALAHGRKRWVLFPPEQARYSTIPAGEFYGAVLPELCRECAEHPGAHCPLQVTQEEGDILFVPREWGHAVLNVQPSVGVAAEFDSVWSRSGDMQ